VDTRYGVDGLARLDGVYSSQLVVLPDGRAYSLAVRGADESESVSLVRFTESGELDRDFGEGGFAPIPVGPLAHLLMQLQQTSAGPRLVVSEWAVFGTAHFYRFRLNGQLDRTFGEGGVSAIQLGREMIIRGLTIADDQTIVSTGECPFRILPYYACILALTPDGAPNDAFDSDGLKVWKDIGRNTSLTPAVITPDGSRIYVGGTANRPRSWMIAAFQADGTPDRGFGDGGVSRPMPDCGPRGGMAQLHLEPSGDLIAFGPACKRTAFARVASDGKLDPAYGEAGWAFVADDGTRATSVLDSTTDTVYWLYGGEDGDFHLAGVRSDGSLDPAFGETRELVIKLDPPATGFWDIGLERDRAGRLYAKAWCPDDVDFRGLVMSRAVDTSGAADG
jgi:uncharacterized delta-60 repeat protein